MSASSVSRSSAPSRILVVDDEPAVGACLLVALRLAGFAPHWFADARLALEHLRASDHELVVLDLIMPGRDGLEVLTEFVREPGAPPVLAISGDEQCLSAAPSLGARGALAKPFACEQFIREVRRVLANGGEAPATLAGVVGDNLGRG